MKLTFLTVIVSFFLLFIFSCNENSHLKRENNIPFSDSSSTNHLNISNQYENFDNFFYQYCFDEKFRIARSQKFKSISNSIPLYTDYKAYLIPSDNFDINNILVSNISEITYSIFSKFDSSFKEFTFRISDSLWLLSSVNECDISSFNPQGFISFISNFSKDSIFQMNHIQFPLKTTFLDYDNDYNDTTTYIDFSEYTVFDIFVENTLSLIYSKQAFDHTDNITILFLGIDNGIRVEHYFKLVNNEWILIELRDFST